MDQRENRQIARASLFVLADLRVDGEDIDHRVKMRNLSAGGMMAEGTVRVARGIVVWVNLRGIGWTEGTVAWIQDNRFGIAFREEIDPALARPATTPGTTGEPFVPFKPTVVNLPRGDGRLRKI